MTTTPPLQLIVHDYDSADLRKRIKALRVALPDADLMACGRRADLLRHLATLPVCAAGRHWPLALIDLEGSAGDRLMRGEHLLQTITAHPVLRTRAALVAFTRYGHASRDRVFESLGARAVLSPSALAKATDNRVAEQLALVAAGSRSFVRIGAPPSVGEQQTMDRLDEFFPSMLRLDGHDKVTAARRLLLICAFAADGHDDRAILALVGAGKSELATMRDQLTSSRAARALAAQRPSAPTMDLGAVGDEMFRRAGRTEARWVLTADRSALSARRLASAQREFASRFLDEDGALLEIHDDAWLPPNSVPVFHAFLEWYDRITRSAHTRQAPAHWDVGATNPTTAQARNRVERALKRTAESFEIEVEAARFDVVHAVGCLEEVAREESFADNEIDDDDDS